MAKFVSGVWDGSDGVAPDKNETECVCILNGIHRGAIVRIHDKPVSLGGMAECDAVLADASIADNRVDLSRSDEGRLTVTLRDGDAAIGFRTMRPERSVALAKGVVLRMGDVRFARGSDFSKVRQEVRLRDKRRTALNWGVAATASLMLIGGVGAVGGSSADAYVTGKSISRTASFTASVNNVDLDATDALRREISQTGLANHIAVEQLAFSEQIRVTGSVTPDERERWAVIERWFDGRFGGRVMLETDLQDRDSSLVVPFRITSVVMAPNPRVVIQDGRVFPIGSILPGGWEIGDIADMKVVLVRGNRELKIAF